MLETCNNCKEKRGEKEKIKIKTVESHRSLLAERVTEWYKSVAASFAIVATEVSWSKHISRISRK